MFDFTKFIMSIDADSNQYMPHAKTVQFVVVIIVCHDNLNCVEYFVLGWDVK